MKVVGSAEIDVEYGDQRVRLPLVIVDGDELSLLGRNWRSHILLNWPSICSIRSCSIKDILAK